MDYLIFGGAILLVAGFVYYRKRRGGSRGTGSGSRDDGPPKFKL